MRRRLSRAKLNRAVRDWATSDGLTWLHLLKTVTAGLLALGIAMLLDLPQPRIAMTTVFVLVQPFSGMVLAKSFYRILGTAVGTVAALVLGGLFVQQPELYMLGMIVWVSACIAAAVRYRHFRWYGFVLAGYTAALIGIPNVTTPQGLFLAALTRAAEVAVGIVCSSAVSALLLPQRSILALRRNLQIRHANFTAYAVDVLARGLERNQFERRFADFVDEIAGFEATRTFVAFEDPAMRSRSAHLPGLNQRFQSGTHDLTSQLRVLLTHRSRRRRDALRWMLATIEVGHAVIDLRNEAARADYADILQPRWRSVIEHTCDDLARLFERPDPRSLERALVAVRSATWLAQDMLQAVHAERDRYHDLQRILSCLHFIRSALLDKDAPFNRR
ncbi:FUSC family protein [Paraburkholderia sp. Cpub6]|uniref:FUSC family protein n=1 Tax=Paraburkholderia sp. Cpub6 TaxID=2723094 RepID=UPI0021A63C67|nr:FUSC family protein [Paraburkholderia sp. Cpub6]